MPWKEVLVLLPGSREGLALCLQYGESSSSLAVGAVWEHFAPWYPFRLVACSGRKSWSSFQSLRRGLTPFLILFVPTPQQQNPVPAWPLGLYEKYFASRYPFRLFACSGRTFWSSFQGLGRGWIPFSYSCSLMPVSSVRPPSLRSVSFSVARATLLAPVM